MSVGCLVVLLEEDEVPSDAVIRRNYRDFSQTIRERVAREIKKRIWQGLPNRITSDPQSGPAAHVWKSDETQHVFYRGGDLHIHELRWHRDEQPHWKRFDLTETARAFAAVNGLSGSPVGYAWENEETQHIFYNGGDGQLHELHSSHRASNRFRSFGSPEGVNWSHRPVRLFGTDPSGLPAVAATGRLAAYVWEEDESEHIIYRGRDNHIYELWRRKGATVRRGVPRGDTWRYTDLTSVTGAPDAVGSPAAYVWPAEERQCVFYRDQDGRIHELRWQRGDDPQWTHFNLTDITPGREANAAGDPVALVWPDTETQHVFYRDTDDRLHELHWRRREGADWRHMNLTDETGGPAAVGDLAAYVWPDDRSLRIFYRDETGHVQELRYRSRDEPRWQRFDLTRITSSTEALAANGPAAYVWEDDERQCVFYIGENAHVYELRWRRGDDPHWSHFDLTRIAEGGEDSAPLTAESLESQVAGRINRRLGEAPFFVDVDQLIGVAFFIFSVEQLLQLPQPNPEAAPFVRAISLSRVWATDSERWELTGSILVNGLP